MKSVDYSKGLFDSISTAGTKFSVVLVGRRWGGWEVEVCSDIPRTYSIAFLLWG